jgi:hypothetical protein
MYVSTFACYTVLSLLPACNMPAYLLLPAVCPATQVCTSLSLPLSLCAPATGCVQRAESARNYLNMLNDQGKHSVLFAA